MSGSEYIEVDIEPGEAAPEGLSLRFRVVRGEAVRAVQRVRYESELGVSGMWRVRAVDADGAQGPARAGRVEDSSEGTVLLVVGGAQGLALEHEASGARERVPYLVLAADTSLE